MRTQTKCTLAICGLLIIELLPMPFTSVYSLYAVRKRPDWLPSVVNNLYADKTLQETGIMKQLSLDFHDPMATRKKCTITLAILFVIDLLVPVIIPTALYVVRRRPEWFKDVIVKLYADKISNNTQSSVAPPKLTFEDPKILKELEKKLVELDAKNLDIAKSLALNSQRRNNSLTPGLR